MTRSYNERTDMMRLESDYPTVPLPLVRTRTQIIMSAPTVALEQIEPRAAEPDAPERHTLSFFEAADGRPLRHMVNIDSRDIIQTTPDEIPPGRLRLLTVHSGNKDKSSQYEVLPDKERRLRLGINVVVCSLHPDASSQLAGHHVHGAIEHAASTTGLDGPGASEEIAGQLIAHHQDLEGLLVAIITVDRTAQRARIARYARWLGMAAGGLLLAKAAEKDTDILLLLGAMGALIKTSTMIGDRLIKLVNAEPPDSTTSLPKQHAPDHDPFSK